MKDRLILDQNNILEIILAEKKKELKKMRKSRRSLKEILKRKDFVLLAEIKKASPSEGLLAEEFKPERQLNSYISARADAVSILTDEKFFQGSTELFRQLRKKTDLPLLRKDFIIDSLQVYESFFIGADIVLLISAILRKEKLKKMLDITHSLGMEALVEVHDRIDLEKAIDAGAEIIGVNNRNLNDFTIDLANTEKIISLLKEMKNRDNYKIISESGITDREDIDYLRKIGVDGVLIGTGLMKADKPGEKIRELFQERGKPYEG